MTSPNSGNSIIALLGMIGGPRGVRPPARGWELKVQDFKFRGRAARRLRAFLFASSALIVVGPSGARAAGATWVAPVGAAPSDYGTASNWTPSGTAFFGDSANTEVQVSSGYYVGGWTFNAGAPAYTFKIMSNGIALTGTGITINGGSASITNVGTLNFSGTSTAGSAAITNRAAGRTDFSQSSGPNGGHKLSAGSLAGAGTFYLGRDGSKQLAG